MGPSARAHAAPRFRLCLLFVAAVFSTAGWAIAPVNSETAKLFEIPAPLERDVHFWVRVYTEVTTDQGLLHDDWNLGVVYEVMKFDPESVSSERARRVDQAKKHYRDLLARFAAGDTASLTDEEQRIYNAFGEHTSSGQFKDAMDGIRFQLGQANRFREGLMRAGIWESHIARTLSQRGVPGEIAALPHVESSFNPDAYSRVGAAGLWQFMPSTARRFMRVDGLVDERMDPFTATEGAANLMLYNYRLLGSWPLAITAYNHGPGGLLQAQNDLGTSDIATIVRRYNGRTFGFASRNFYVAFLAALEVDRNADKYFGHIPKQPDAESTTFELPDYIPVGTLVTAFKVDRGALHALNPALRPPIWSGTRFVPRGYALRLPGSVANDQLQASLARVPNTQRYLAQRSDGVYRARRGDTVLRVAQAQGIPLDRLLAVNGWTTQRAIKRGQVLRLPLPGTRAAGAPSNAALLAEAKESLPPEETSAVQAPAAPAPVASTQMSVKPRPGAVPPAPAQVASTVSPNTKAPTAAAEESAPWHPPAARPRKAPPPGQLETPALAELAKNTTPSSTGASSGQPPSGAESATATSSTATPFGEEAVPGATLPKSAREPVTEHQADATAALLPGAISSNNADPADYGVDKQQRIIVQADETLGHYADWAGTTASQLRRLNHLKKGSFVSLGHKVKVDFSRVPQSQFEATRREYHKNLQDAYFATHRISGSESYTVKRGESLWTIVQQHDLPIWLARQYNPRVDFSDVRPGTVISLPKIAAAIRE